MIPAALSSFVALAALSAPFVKAQQATFPATALASKHFPWPTGVPYQADTDTNLVRGAQHGYNICNSTTEGQSSMCQTSFINSIEGGFDIPCNALLGYCIPSGPINFCLWGPPEPNSEVGSTEGEMVAWCTKPGHGTRLIPRGALTGVQWIRTPDYVAIIGFLDQTKVNIAAGDYGGEMDPHGADLRGNPLGGLMYSNAWGSGGDDYTQVIEWHNFIGGDAFCLKACDPAGPNAAHFCEHVYDRIGCAYNVPNNAQNNVFESCDGDNQDYPGIYVSDGVTMTYKQPAESLGPITTMPYTPRVPKTSNCVTYDSASLYSGLVTFPTNSAVSTSSAASSSATPSGASSSSAASSSGSSSHSSVSATGTTSRTAAPGAFSTGNAGASASGSGTAQGAQQSAASDATAIAISGISVLGVVFSALFLS